ncbi:MAG: putative b-1,4-glucosyltransferase, Glycosyltransferase Family 2 [uncultured bacterium]|uniref:Glycosyltransferase 2-like domain-containing protein n=1 Tax=candidate division WWE3 bacterium RIFOXYA2_FULL_46_9 TaxID=1802636 RepID=A0A1F4VZE7_UNCKA|nr:MAG: putative b-1,4-glucosyltransferase, Glycosyltransferase Family 2 [uncultured bacterium]OGC62534.1 MAG: hypothetical protein A2264_04895 [candidate division WWE3 bacterium RIFOXYA2_FULL_46_9]
MLTVSTQLAREDDLATFTQMLKSVSFADEILIFNLERTDPAALSLFHRFHARIIEVKTPPVIERIRNRQIREAKGDWVLVMDYDEIIPPKLATEIKTIISRSPSFAAYQIKRRNYSLGMPLSHGGFGADYVHRLFNRARFRTWPPTIHSTPQVDGPVGRLHATMEHHKDASLSQMVIKTNRYSKIEAQQFLDGGLALVTRFTLIRKIGMEFCRRYILKLGFLDGRIGLLQALYQSYSVFLTYAKLYELQKKGQRG